MAFKNRKNKSLPVNVKENAKFAFCTEVLKLKSLHYGYWDRKEKLSLENVQNAQERYTETMLDLIPEGTESILDVGCGIGDVSFRMAEKGYKVTSISPDINHKRFFDDSPLSIEFHNNKFEEFQSENKYDLILMSESQNYFDTDTGFQQCKKYLNPGGHLLVSGMFRKKDVQNFEKVRNIDEDYIKKAEEYDLILLKKFNITKNVLPTIEYADHMYKEYIVPSINILKRFMKNGTQFKIKLLKMFFAKEFWHIKKSQEYYEERFDPEQFLEHVKYLRLVFKNNSG